MQIVMVGSGYVGLVSGACFSDFGHQVTCVDLDTQKIADLNNGNMPIYEPGLADLVERNVQAGRLFFSTEIEKSIARADVVFVAVGTPSRRGDGFADLAYVYDAAKMIANAVDGFTVVVTKSTVPVGAGDEVERIMRQQNPEADVAVVANPEFLREGAAIQDFKHPDRIVIGVEDDRAKSIMSEVYRPLYLNQAPLMFTSRRSAELTKYAANAFLALKITFINEMADLCEAMNADVQDIARGIGLDKRIGPKFLNAGPGFGGSCFPKDTLALVKTARDHSAPLRLVETTIAVNDERKHAMAHRIVKILDDDVRGKTIGILGLTFKPNTDDMREAPSITIIQALQKMGAKVKAFDPKGTHAARALLPDVEYCANPYEVATNAHAMVIVTEWEAFRALDFARLGAVMHSKLLIDLRNIYRHGEVEPHGFRYHSIGRPNQYCKLTTPVSAVLT